MTDIEGWLLSRMSVRRWLATIAATAVLVAAVAATAGYGLGRRSIVGAAGPSPTATVESGVGHDGLGQAVLGVAQDQAESEATGAKSASKLHQIGIALLLYQTDHNQQSPATLDGLIGEGTLSAADLACPRAGCVYRYAGAPAAGKLPEDNAVVAYEWPPERLAPYGGGWVLRGDGQPTFLTIDELKQAVSTGEAPAH